MRKALSYLLVFIFVQFFFSWAVYAVWILSGGGSLTDVLKMFGGDKPLDATAPMLITASAVCSAVLLALFIWRKWAVVSPAYLRTRPWGVFFWCAVASVGTILPSVWLQEQLPELPDLAEDTFKMMMSSRYGYFTLCLLVPFVEELVFRGAILRSLSGFFKNPWAAIALSSAMFALVHGNPAQMPHALLIGLLLGWMYVRTGSILPGVILHWVNNTVAYVLYVLLPQSADMKLIEFFGGDEKRVVLSVVFSLFILVPGLYQFSVRSKDAVSRGVRKLRS